MKDKGFVNEPCMRKGDSTTVFSFPVKAPEVCITRNELDPITHLELWLIYQKYYCEHKPSVTINVKEDEWMEVGAWVYKHFDDLTGVSFLPHDGGTYKQSPYMEMSEEEYNNLLSKTPEFIDWDELLEHEDNVEGAQTLSCSAGVCDLI